MCLSNSMHRNPPTRGMWIWIKLGAQQRSKEKVARYSTFSNSGVLIWPNPLLTSVFQWHFTVFFLNRHIYIYIHIHTHTYIYIYTSVAWVLVNLRQRLSQRFALKNKTDVDSGQLRHVLTMAGASSKHFWHPHCAHKHTPLVRTHASTFTESIVLAPWPLNSVYCIHILGYTIN